MMTSITVQTNKNRKIKKIGTAAAVSLLWLALWQGVYLAVGQEVLVVSPAAVFLRMCALAGTGDFWLAAVRSLLRIMAGFFCGVALGTALAALCAALPPVKAFFSPALHVVKATPVASFIILALVWMSRAHVPVFICILMVLPIVWGNVMAGAKAVDRSLLEMARVFHFSKRKLLTKLYVPTVLPYFISGCTTGMGLAWKAGIAAEVLSTPAFSIGTKIYESKVYLETVDLFAWTALVILLSVLLERLFVLCMRRVNRNYSRKEG